MDFGHQFYSQPTASSSSQAYRHDPIVNYQHHEIHVDGSNVADQNTLDGNPDPDHDDHQPRKGGAGGRPRDKVWDLFDGDRDAATCRHCMWRTDHPKAFRMRAHVEACEGIPQDKKDMLHQWQQQKVEKKAVKVPKPPRVDSEGNPLPPVVHPSKKFKRTHDEIVVQPNLQQTGLNAPLPIMTSLRSPITCHVLDSTSGKPAPDLRVRLDRLQGQTFVVESQSQTDSDGRCSNLLAPSTRLETGIYKITFYTSEYFTARGISSFYPFVEIPFEVKIAEEHYHVPLLLAPYSYSTYRGS